MRIKSFIFLVLTYICSVTNVSATVITGINESTSALFTGGIEVGDIGIGWTEANEFFGYVYNGQLSAPLTDFFRPETQFANVVDSSVWFQPYDTYNGFSSNNEIKDASQYAYFSQNIMFADKDSPWYRGILLAKQGNNYLAIDPLDVFINELGDYTLKYEYWYGTEGETDLSMVVSVPEPGAFLLFAIALLGLMIIRRTKIQKTA